MSRRATLPAACDRSDGAHSRSQLADALGLLHVDAQFLREMTDPARLGDLLAQLGFAQTLWDVTDMFRNFPSWSSSAEMVACCAFGPTWTGVRGIGRDLVVLAPLVFALLVTSDVYDPGFGGAFGHRAFRAIAGFLVGCGAKRLWRMVSLRARAADLPVVRLLAPFVFGSSCWCSRSVAGASPGCSAPRRCRR
jgi:hypothetical protein